MEQKGDTALAIVPPAELWESIEALRAVHDKSYARWPPHCNLFFPFVSVATFSTSAATLKKALDAKKIGSFKVRLNHFYHTKESKYMEIRVDGENGEACKAIYDIVKVTVTSLKLAPKKEDYVPHFTIGQCAQGEIDETLAALQADWTPLEWTVEELCLMHRPKDRFKTVEKINLV